MGTRIANRFYRLITLFSIRGRNEHHEIATIMSMRRDIDSLPTGIFAIMFPISLNAH